MITSARMSYAFIGLLFVLVAWLHLSTPFLAVLFSYFALERLAFGGRKYVAIGLFLLVLAVVGAGGWYFIKQAYVALPHIAEKSIPVVLDYAEKQNVDLPFTDIQSLKRLALDKVRSEIADLGKYAKVITIEIAGLIIGIVAGISLFLNSRIDLDQEERGKRTNLYAEATARISDRVATLYESFATVMGAQIIISGINTTLTSVFLFWNNFPFAGVIVVVTFLCGLLPIIGNLMSNTLIVGVAFTISPKMALISLIYLVVLHKLEYFLNSKIIGDRIRNPMWLTLLGLIVGEKLMGIPGMILAPVVLYYIKVEAKRRAIHQTQSTVTSDSAAPAMPVDEIR